MAKLPQPVEPASAIREYNRFLNSYAAAYEKLMREGLEEIIPTLKATAGSEIPRADSIRMDANIEERLKALFDFINKRLELMFPNSILRAWAARMIGDVNRNNKKNTQKAMGAAYKRTKQGRKAKEVPDFAPLMTDGKLHPYFLNVVDENVGLIRSIPAKKLPAFKNQLTALITQDATAKDISAAIQKNFKASRASANLIARDQIGKLNGALNKYRQQQLGGTRYFWRTARDRRCREQHKKLGAASDRGVTYKWTKPPLSDPNTGRHCNPGEDFQCRCWAEMDMTDVLA